MSRHLLFVALALLAGVAASEGPSEFIRAPRPLPPDHPMRVLSVEAARTLAERGWLLVDTPGPEDAYFEGLEALVIFERPHEEVLQLLAQTSRQGEYRDDLKRVETVARLEGGEWVDEHRMRIMFVRIAYRIRYELDAEERELRWRLDPAFENSLEHLEGYWELYELEDERTVARFGTDVQIGPAVPPILQDSVTRSKLPKSIDQTRRWVNSGGRTRP